MEGNEKRSDTDPQAERGPEEPAEAEAQPATEEVAATVPGASGTQGKVCVTCGAPLLWDARFCLKCGNIVAQGEPAAPSPPTGGLRPYVLTAGISAVVLLFAAALFAAGFWTHSLLDDDVDLTAIEEELASLDERTGQIEEILSGAVGGGNGGGDGGGTSPTPSPVVAATADDDPFIGPADAPVTIIEFSDYQ